MDLSLFMDKLNLSRDLCDVFHDLITCCNHIHNHKSDDFKIQIHELETKLQDSEKWMLSYSSRQNN